jgi:hypothetical protein
LNEWRGIILESRKDENLSIVPAEKTRQILRMYNRMVIQHIATITMCKSSQLIMFFFPLKFEWLYFITKEGTQYRPGELTLHYILFV